MADTTTTSRVLALLNLLQTHRHWSGPELALRLRVTDRTLRRDVERLRDLGYRVESVPGAGGGYRLEAGTALPPLLLTDDEAVTMAIGLRAAATQALSDGTETTLTALAKLEQVLPSALRQRVNALAAAVQPPPPNQPAVSAELLGQLALACRDHERIRFSYTAADGNQTERQVEPHALVPFGRYWFLVAWDLRRGQWRTFRVDRLARFFGTRVRFTPRTIPGGSAAEYVAAAHGALRSNVTADVLLRMPLEEMKEFFGPYGGEATDAGDGWTRWPISGAGVQEMLFALVWIPEHVEYRIEGNPEFAAFARGFAARIAAASTPAP